MKLICDKNNAFVLVVLSVSCTQSVLRNFTKGRTIFELVKTNLKRGNTEMSLSFKKLSIDVARIAQWIFTFAHNISFLKKNLFCRLAYSIKCLHKSITKSKQIIWINISKGKFMFKLIETYCFENIGLYLNDGEDINSVELYHNGYGCVLRKYDPVWS